MSIKQIRKTLQETSAFSKVIDAIAEKKPVRLEKFAGSSFSFLVEALSRKTKSILVIFNEHEDAQFLQADLRELGLENTLLFPPTFHKPYDAKHLIDTAVMVDRSEVLETMSGRRKNVLVTSSAAIFDKIPPAGALGIDYNNQKRRRNPARRHHHPIAGTRVYRSSICGSSRRVWATRWYCRRISFCR